MPVTKFGIIYSIAQSKCRTCIVPEVDDSELDAHGELQPGEGWLTLPIEQFDGPQTNFDALVAGHTGIPTTSDRCAVIDAGGTVVAVVRADPAIDKVSGCTIMQNDDVETGWVYVAGQLYPPSPDPSPSP